MHCLEEMSLKRLNVLIATIVGVALFLLDMKTGLISYIFVIPSVITIAIITGIVALDVGEGVLAALLYMVIGITIIVFLHPLILPEWGELSDSVLTKFIVVMMYSILYSFDFSSWPWLLAPLVIALLFILAPIIYGIALMLSVLGGFIGRGLAGQLRKRGKLSSESSGPMPAAHPDPGVLE